MGQQRWVDIDPRRAPRLACYCLLPGDAPRCPGALILRAGVKQGGGDIHRRPRLSRTGSAAHGNPELRLMDIAVAEP